MCQQRDCIIIISLHRGKTKENKTLSNNSRWNYSLKHKTPNDDSNNNNNNNSIMVV